MRRVKIASHRFRSPSVYLPMRSVFAMRKFWGFTFVALVSLTLASPLSAAPQFGRQRDRGRGEGQVCIYKDIQYLGVEQCFKAGESIETLQSLDHQPYYLRITGRATVADYNDETFCG